MRLGRKLGITLVFQILGLGSTALTQVLITRRYGPQGQGYLCYWKSTVEFVASIGLFGLPQALVYLLNAHSLQAKWAIKLSTYYCIALGLLGAGVTSAMWLFRASPLQGFDRLAMASIVIASTTMILHGLYRSISLSTRSIVIFNLITIMPAVISLCLYAVWRSAKPKELVLVVIVAWVASSLAAALILNFNPFSGRLDELSITLEKIKQTVGYSFWSFIPGLSYSLVIAGSYRLIHQEEGDAGVGQFSVSLLILSMAVLPLTMIVPILYDTWSKEANRPNNRRSFLALSHLGTMFGILACILGVILVEPVTLTVFGSAFSPSVRTTKFMLLSAYAIYQTRLLSAMLLAVGRPHTVAFAAVLRSGVIFLAISQEIFGSTDGLAWAWNVGEYISVLYMCSYISRLTGWPLTQIAGLSPSWIWENSQAFPLLYSYVRTVCRPPQSR